MVMDNEHFFFFFNYFYKDLFNYMINKQKLYEIKIHDIKYLFSKENTKK